jgi:hypothetical protein
MLHIREDPIHCIGDKCVYSSKKNIEHLPKLHNYNDLYGAEDYSKGRFKDLGIPFFVLKFSENLEEPVQEEKMQNQCDGVISEQLFEKLFDIIEKKPKTKAKTQKKRKKEKKEKKEKKTK